MTARETAQAIREQLGIDVDAITYDNRRDEIAAISGVTETQRETIRSAFSVRDEADLPSEPSE